MEPLLRFFMHLNVGVFAILAGMFVAISTAFLHDLLYFIRRIRIKVYLEEEEEETTRRLPSVEPSDEYLDYLEELRRIPLYKEEDLV